MPVLKIFPCERVVVNDPEVAHPGPVEAVLGLDALEAPVHRDRGAARHKNVPSVRNAKD